MVYSSSADKAGIVEDIDFLTNSDSTTYSIEDKTRNVNRWLDRVQYLITKADGRWQYDDANMTDLPIATTDLVLNQQDYSLIPLDQIEIIRMEVKDTSGTWNLLLPMDARDVQDIALEQFLASGGVPKFYDVFANSIFLYPSPNYASDEGLKIWYKRPSSYFVSTDTDKSPGFAPQFHRILSYGAALDYAVSQKDLAYKVPAFEREIMKLEDAIMKFYNRREKDENIHLGVRYTRWR